MVLLIFIYFNKMIEKFNVRISDKDIDELRTKIKLTRWPDEINNKRWSHGTSLSFLKKLSKYWLDDFDWRIHEDQINKVGSYKFKTKSGLKIHFLHRIITFHTLSFSLILQDLFLYSI